MYIESSLHCMDDELFKHIKTICYMYIREGAWYYNEPWYMW